MSADTEFWEIFDEIGKKTIHCELLKSNTILKFDAYDL